MLHVCLFLLLLEGKRKMAYKNFISVLIDFYNTCYNQQIILNICGYIKRKIQHMEETKNINTVLILALFRLPTLIYDSSSVIPF